MIYGTNVSFSIAGRKILGAGSLGDAILVSSTDRGVCGCRKWLAVVAEFHSGPHIQR